MTNTSLEIVTEAIFKVLEELDIDKIDKLELMLNLSKFLSPEEYEENIRVLNKKRSIRY